MTGRSITCTAIVVVGLLIALAGVIYAGLGLGGVAGEIKIPIGQDQTLELNNVPTGIVIIGLGAALLYFVYPRVCAGVAPLGRIGEIGFIKRICFAMVAVVAVLLVLWLVLGR